MSRKPYRSLAFTLFVSMLAAAAPAAAQSVLSSLEIHGFGGWAYGDTDGLDLAVGDADGQYDNAEFALNLSARPTDRLSVVAQIFLESHERGGGEEAAELDYAFAEWFVSDALKVRAGRVKHPIGLYGEIFDVGTLRPFHLLPQGVYGPVGVTAKAYNGVGLTGSRELGAGWGAQYDLYGGEIEGDYTIFPLSPVDFDGNPVTETSISFGYNVGKTIGGRLNVTTPIEGLTVGVSAYEGSEALEISGQPDTDRTVFLGHAEYLTPQWSLRTEWGQLKSGDAFEEEFGYFELAYRVTPKWQVAGRYETWEIDFPFDFSQFIPFWDQLNEHEELALGVNYWLSPQLVVRLNFHQVEGNRFTFPGSPEQIAEIFADGRLDEETELIILGTQFSF